MKNKKKTSTVYQKENSPNNAASISAKNNNNFEVDRNSEKAEEIFKTKLALLVLCVLATCVITCIILIHCFATKLNSHQNVYYKAEYKNGNIL